jgi:transketolase C-terminal domain/subunit
MTTTVMRYREALTQALAEEMAADPAVVLLGEDIGVYGGVFKVTSGLLERFGPRRVRDTPISENAITGIAVGAAITGLRPVVEIMYSDFITLASDSLVNAAALFGFTYGGQVSVPLVIRTQGGAGASAGPQHSKSLEVWLAHVPGLQVILPATPADAKGLLKSAIRSGRPAVFFEHKLLYNQKGPVPDGDYRVPIGVADIKRPGSDVTVVAVSRMVTEALAAADARPRPTASRPRSSTCGACAPWIPRRSWGRPGAPAGASSSPRHGAPTGPPPRSQLSSPSRPSDRFGGRSAGSARWMSRSRTARRSSRPPCRTATASPRQPMASLTRGQRHEHPGPAEI